MNSSMPLCADTARERGDPMSGTALRVDRFLLLEHPGPWSFDALGGSGLDPGVLDQIVAATRSADGRTLLIRRHGRVDSPDERRWAVADIVTGRIRWGSWRDDTDLLAAAAALGEPSDDWPTDPVLLVCTHGRHDTCCAVRGRPVAEALASRHPELTWECTHVGGDRFAASVVVLPDGTYYGGLDDTDALDVLERHLDGTVTPDRLRGSSRLPPVAQAAAIAAHERYGPGGPRDVDAAIVEAVGQRRWRVELSCTGRLPARLEAVVESRQGSPAVLTCKAAKSTSARTYVVTSLREV